MDGLAQTLGLPSFTYFLNVRDKTYSHRFRQTSLLYNYIRDSFQNQETIYTDCYEDTDWVHMGFAL